MSGAFAAVILALDLLKQDKTCKLGIDGKRLQAVWDHTYLLRLFGVADQDAFALAGCKLSLPEIRAPVYIQTQRMSLPRTSELGTNPAATPDELALSTLLLSLILLSG